LPHFDLTKPDPLNYLTTPTIGTGIVKPSEAKKTVSDEYGLSVTLPARTIQFTTGKTGDAVFTIYSLAGKRIAQKRAVLSQAQGSMTWRELGNLPVGIYMVTMNVNDNFLGKVRFCTL
jgi:hypothetical protein